MKIKFTILITLALFIIACSGNGNFIPKPRGLNHIELPPAAYQALSADSLPYSFNYSTHSAFEPHQEDASIQIVNYKNLGAKIWLTYFPIENSEEKLDSVMLDAYRLLQKNNVKAESIVPDTIKTENGKSAMVFVLSGEVPTQLQFIMHDTTTNFMRGALYFETAKKNDSLAPVINYIRKDIEELVRTLEWKQ